MGSGRDPVPQPARISTPGNPLRRAGRLAAVCGIEYGLQAAALHGALLRRRRGAAGRLRWRALRAVALRVDRLDDPALGTLGGRGAAGARGAGGMVYAFALAEGQARCWSTARATIALPAMRRALVTGGASPLGAAICRRLAADGLHVLVHAHAGAGAGPRRWRRRSAGGEALGCDLADIGGDRGGAGPVLGRRAAGRGAQCRDARRRADGRHERGAMARRDRGVARRVLRRAAAAAAADDGTRWGRIVAVSRCRRCWATAARSNYAAAKAGLIGAVRSLAREVASRGITVNAVAPGVIASPAVDAAMDAGADRRDRADAARRARRRRWPTWSASLCSDRAGYITGQAISINGGMA